MYTKRQYRDFATREASGHSATYAEPAEGIAADPGYTAKKSVSATFTASGRSR